MQRSAHQRDGPSDPAWRVGRKVGKAPSSVMSDGSFEPGTAVANVLSSGVTLSVLCSSERKGCRSTQWERDVVVRHYDYEPLRDVQSICQERGIKTT